jgi:error-prone DNA polymerase
MALPASALPAPGPAPACSMRAEPGPCERGTGPSSDKAIRPGQPCPDYVELHLHTNYSLLEGASHPREMVERAAAYGYRALAITDRDNLYGALEFARLCREHGIQPIAGVELTVAEDPDAGTAHAAPRAPDAGLAGRAGPHTQAGSRAMPGSSAKTKTQASRATQRSPLTQSDTALHHGTRHSLVLLAESRQGWANLCRLVSLAHGHAEPTQAGRERRRRDPCLARHHLASHSAGLICLTGGRRSEVAMAVDTALRRGPGGPGAQGQTGAAQEGGNGDPANPRDPANTRDGDHGRVDGQGQAPPAGGARGGSRRRSGAEEAGGARRATGPAGHGDQGRATASAAPNAHGGGATGPTDGQQGSRDRASQALDRLIAEFGVGNVYVELQDNLVHGDLPRCRALVELAHSLQVTPVATGDVHYHDPLRHRLHDVLCSIRHRTTLDQSHQLRRPNGQLYLRSPTEQSAHFAAWPEAIQATADIAGRCASFDLNQDLGYRLPSPPVPAGHTPDTWLAHLCHQALRDRYEPAERPAATSRLDQELALISRHGLAGFFLVYHEVLQLATQVAAEIRQGAPRAQANLPPGRGRGSSVGSVVCYLIGLSHIDPVRNNLFLGRFLNEDLVSLPDIDLDFPRDIRDRLFRAVYERWGTEHAALVATFPRYRVRSAIRDVGKALGLPGAELDRLAKQAEGWGSARTVKQEMLGSPQFAPLVEAPGWRHLIELSYELADFPRHVSQHVGGVVIASDPLVDCVSLQPAAWPGRYVCQWDKDSVDDAGMVKIDVLALGMLSLVEECLDLVATHEQTLVDLSRIDFSDRSVYDRIHRADTVGVFQIESRAQAAILSKTRPANLDDLAAQVAIIRPGPIVGGAIHPYVSRRQALRSALESGRPPPPVELPHPCLTEALSETLGVVLYQEQVLQVAMAMGGFTPGEAESFRRAMGRRDSKEAMEAHRRRFLEGARQRGVPPQVGEEVFATLCGFAEFGFPKSHATAFALLAYQSAWLKEHYPAAFYCSLLNNWPMGFYPPHVLAGDARRHGVPLRRPNINASGAACTLEGGAVRLGLSWIKGLSLASAEEVVAERDRGGPYRSPHDLLQRMGLSRDALESATRVGALDDFGGNRRELLWRMGLVEKASGAHRPGRPRTGRARQLTLPLPTLQDEVALPDSTRWQRLATDYELLGLSPTDHPLGLLRPDLPPQIRSSAQLRGHRQGSAVQTAGLVVCRQRPGTAKGVVFLLLEDEHGMVSAMVSASLYEARRTVVRTSPFLLVEGVVEGHAGEVAQLRARALYPLRLPALLAAPGARSWA